MVRPGSGRFEVGFWVGFWVGLRARDSPTEEVLSRTPLIIRTVDQYLEKIRAPTLTSKLPQTSRDPKIRSDKTPTCRLY